MGLRAGAAKEREIADLIVPDSGLDLAGHVDWVQHGKSDGVLAVSEVEGPRRDGRSVRRDFPQSLTAWEDVQWQKACDQDVPTSYA